MFLSSDPKRKKLFAVGLGGLLILGCLLMATLDWVRPQPKAATSSPMPSPLSSQTDATIISTLSKEVQVTQRPVVNTLSIEALPVTVMVISGAQTPGGAGTGEFISPRDSNATTYTLRYQLPEDDTPAYVRLAFGFDPPQDLSGYGFVQLTIDFGQPNTSCHFYVQSRPADAQDLSQVTLGSGTASDGIAVLQVGAGIYQFTIPWPESFAGVGLSNITELGISLGTPTQHGSGTLTVRDIQFLSP